MRVPYTPTERLCLGIHLRHEPTRLFAMLGVYVDESGTHTESPRTVMAGCVASVEQWSGLERSWAALLAAHGLRYAHATELRQGKGQFKGWSSNRRSDFARKLTRLICDYSDYFVTVMLNNQEYEAHYRDPDKSVRKRRGVVDSKYGVCFRVFATSLVTLVRQRTPGESVTITLEAGHKNAGAAETIFADLAKHDPESADIISAVAYVDKEKNFGVQAADLMAYIYFRQFNEKLLSRRVEFELPNAPTLTPSLASVFSVTIVPETLSDIRSGQITRAQQERWMRSSEGRLAG